MSFIIDPYRFGCPAEALAFIAAAGITDATQKQAICTLVSDLQAFGIWTKMKAIYPFVGGTSAAHSYNLKNTSQYQITWNGGVTHNSNGILGNGVNGYGNTNTNTTSQNTAHISIYSRTNSVSGNCSMGFGVGVIQSSMFLRYSAANDNYIRVNEQGNSSAITFNNSSGLFVANRISSTTKRNFLSNSIVQQLDNSTGTSGFPIFISALNASGSPILYDNRQFSFASIGDGFNDTELNNLYTAVQKYQTTLGRQV